jgi:predicted O-linked N-acetylglucosamine transferase (SPINDLY family)
MTQISLEQAMQVALGHHQAGHWAEAEQIYLQILSHYPGYAGALQGLGIIASQAGDLARAVELTNQAITVAPAVAEYHNNLGEFYRRMGRLADATASLNRAIELKPDLAVAHGNLGNVLRAAGRLDEAIAAYERAIAAAPCEVEFYINSGLALYEIGRSDEAIEALQHAIALQPENVLAHRNLGAVLHAARRSHEAIAAYRHGLALKEDDAKTLTSLAMVLLETDQPAEAMAALDRAIQLDPNLAAAHNNRGNALWEAGRLDEAIAAFRRANELEPEFPYAASNILFLLYRHPAYDAQAILAEHRAWARRYAEPLAGEILPSLNDRAPERRLRIGFLSPDFRGHPVGQLIRPLFAHHDRRRCEFVCYSDVRAPDALTLELQGLADEWHNTVGLRDPQLADRIRHDRIDIVVDLAVHLAGNRLLVFARKPAPVQVTMLGMIATTGLATIDYRLTDAYLDPPGLSDADYTEQSIRLPHGCWCYRTIVEGIPVGELPAMRKGHVTFGCLNQFAKVSRQTLEVWVNILRAVPGSRLIIHSHPGSHRNAVCGVFKEGGVEPDRVEFVPRVSGLSYLLRHHDLDLCLDTFPHAGGTTTLDALWMGLPVVTLAGRTAVGRGGVSILSHLGLPQFIGDTPEQYVAIARECAGDLSRLAELRGQLRERMRSSVLMDGVQHATDVEAAFRQMWQRWCAS